MMNLRKINASLSLLCTFLLMDHAICHTAWMLFEISLHKLVKSFPWILFGLMLVHAIISIVLAVLGHKGTEKGKYNSYPNMNRATMIQRASGMSLILFTVLHIAGTVGILEPPKLVQAILSPVFFTIALAHTAVSTSKAFITLGIGNAKLIKTVDIAMKVLCGATLIAAVVGFYRYSL